MSRTLRFPDRQKIKAPETVMFAYCHPGEVSAIFMASFFGMFQHELRRGGAAVGTLDKLAGTGSISHVRNLLTEQFVHGTTADWLWFVDADMGFPPWALERLLAAADKKERPVVGGLCFGLVTADVDPVTGAEIYESFPTIGYWNRDEEGNVLGYRYATDYDFDPPKVAKVDSTGAACVLIHRSALEKIGGDWWTPIRVPEGAPGLAGKFGYFGEDISFFIRCADKQIPVWLDTAVRTAHHKGAIYLTHELYQEQRAKRLLLEELEKQNDGGAA